MAHLNLGDTLAHDLFRRIIDQDVKSFEFGQVIIDDLLAVFRFHEVQRECKTFRTVCFDGFFDSLGTGRRSDLSHVWASQASRHDPKQC